MWECYVQELKARRFKVQALVGEDMVEAPLPPPKNLDLRLETRDEKGLQLAEANEFFSTRFGP